MLAEGGGMVRLSKEREGCLAFLDPPSDAAVAADAVGKDDDFVPVAPRVKGDMEEERDGEQEELLLGETTPATFLLPVAEIFFSEAASAAAAAAAYLFAAPAAAAAEEEKAERPKNPVSISIAARFKADDDLVPSICKRDESNSG